MNIRTQKFEANEVSRLASIDPAKMQLWLSRNLVVGQSEKIEGGGSRGIRRQFSFLNVMEIAVARALVDAGLTPKSAFKVSLFFSHTGDGEHEVPQMRHLGLPFHYQFGDTILATSLGQHWIGPMNTDDGGGLSRALSNLSIAAGCTVESASIVNASQVFKSICSGLSLDPFKVLDEAYADQPGEFE